jgi:hypothetical protein
MKKVKSIKPQETKFSREYALQVGNFTIAQGDIIKIEGEHGGKFKFDSVVTNTENGKVWVDCFDVHKKSMGAYRSYSIDRVKRIPTKRGKRKKNVD